MPSFDDALKMGHDIKPKPFNNVDTPAQAALARANEEGARAPTKIAAPRGTPRDPVRPGIPSTGYEPRRLMTTLTSAERKHYPICTGVFDYFPDALAEVAKISFEGNQKHNPGQELHWSRNKSADHPDCAARHLIERGGFDPQGNRHSAQLVWRALAICQEEIEAERALDAPRGATALPSR